MRATLFHTSRTGRILRRIEGCIEPDCHQILRPGHSLKYTSPYFCHIDQSKEVALAAAAVGIYRSNDNDNQKRTRRVMGSLAGSDRNPCNLNSTSNNNCLRRVIAVVTPRLPRLNRQIQVFGNI
jgi:hypothetical protein